MAAHRYHYTLTDLLCLSEFRKIIAPTGSDDSVKALTGWAEQEVMAGNDSESLLILASLNLDKTPDIGEVRHYLDRFIIETGQSYPGQALSALIWLKIKLWKITHCEDAETAEAYLHYFAIHFFDYEPPFFARTCSTLNWLYYFLFDDCGELYLSRASTMTEDELLVYIKNYVSQFERKLHSQDWLALLAKEQEKQY